MFANNPHTSDSIQNKEPESNQLKQSPGETRTLADAAPNVGQLRQRPSEEDAEAGPLPGSGLEQAGRHQLGLREVVYRASASDAPQRQPEARGLALANFGISQSRETVAGGLQVAEWPLQRINSATRAVGGTLGLASLPRRGAVGGHGDAYQKTVEQTAIGLVAAGAVGGLDKVADVLTAEARPTGKLFRAGLAQATERKSAAEQFTLTRGTGDHGYQQVVGPTSQGLMPNTGGTSSVSCASGLRSLAEPPHTHLSVQQSNPSIETKGLQGLRVADHTGRQLSLGLSGARRPDTKPAPASLGLSLAKSEHKRAQ